MLRTIAITLVLLLSVGIMLPFANSAHGIRQSTQVTQKKSKRYRSRAWWRRYRARLRARRAAEELARRNAMMAVPQTLATAVPQNVGWRSNGRCWTSFACKTGKEFFVVQRTATAGDESARHDPNVCDRRARHYAVGTFDHRADRDSAGSACCVYCSHSTGDAC
jgi:hypothetical protein